MSGPGLTPGRLREARLAFGLSAAGFARLVQVENGRTVRRWEAGERAIPGPVAVLTDALLRSEAVRAHFGLPQQISFTA